MHEPLRSCTVLELRIGREGGQCLCKRCHNLVQLTHLETRNGRWNPLLALERPLEPLLEPPFERWNPPSIAGHPPPSSAGNPPLLALEPLPAAFPTVSCTTTSCIIYKQLPWSLSPGTLCTKKLRVSFLASASPYLKWPICGTMQKVPYISAPSLRRGEHSSLLLLQNGEVLVGPVLLFLPLETYV